VHEEGVSPGISANLGGSCKSPSPSFLRKQESSLFKKFWTPAFAGMTAELNSARASVLTFINAVARSGHLGLVEGAKE